jgi:hypothetical protein
MTIANPIFLWALAGLAIPVGIHLLSRKEGKILKLGSLRHVHETSTQQFRGVRLNEIPLLLLRCALIAILSLMLAGIFFPAPNYTKWLLVEKGLEVQPRINQMIDSLKNDGYEPRWLTSGFPPLRDSVPETQRIRYRELVAELEGMDISSIIVFSRNNPESFTGMRSRLSDNIFWISQPAGNSDYTLKSFRITKDSIVRRQAHTDANATTFEYSSTKEEDGKEIPEPAISVGLIADQKYQRDKTIAKAALDALNGMVPARIIVEEIPTKAMTANWCIWLSDKEPPSGSVIRMKPGKESRLAIRSGPSQWELTKRLDEYVAIQSNLPLTLAQIIVPTRGELEASAHFHDRRLMPDSIAWSFGGNVASNSRKAGVHVEPAEPFLLVIFLMILAVERILAYRKKQ